MKNKKTAYAILMFITLAGMGVGAYFLIKKKGVKMQTASPGTETETETQEGDQQVPQIIGVEPMIPDFLPSALPDEPAISIVETVAKLPTLFPQFVPSTTYKPIPYVKPGSFIEPDQPVYGDLDFDITKFDFSAVAGLNF